MDDEMIKEERKRRFLLLLARYSNQEEAADILGFSSSRLVSNYKNGHKLIGEKVARRIEDRAQLSAGTFVSPFSVPWMGHDTSYSSRHDTESEISGSILTQSGTIGVTAEYAHIQSFESWSGSSDKEFRTMSVPVELLAKLDLKADQLKSIAMPDNSQAGRIMKGDYVAIDIRWGSIIKNDTVYAVKMGVYTLRRATYTTSGGIILSCSNPDYPDEFVSRDDIPKLTILGEFVLFQGLSI